MKLGFIGSGNMGGAMARAACKKLDSKNVYVSGKSLVHSQALAQDLGCNLSTNEEIAQKVDYIFLGVKPQMMAEMLKGIAPILAERKANNERFVLVSMAAGMTIDKLAELAGDSTYPMIRIMPNMPAAIGEGAILYCKSNNVLEEEMQEFLQTMENSGKFYAIAEHLIDAASSICGTGPAYAALFVEALADGGVACGVPRVLALHLAEQMLLGTAKQLLLGMKPADLKDAVCSPGGTTIQGVRALEKGGLRSATIEAVIASFEKNKDFR